MGRIVTRWLAVIGLVASLASPSIAMATDTVTAKGPKAPLVVGSTDVQFWLGAQPGMSAVIVSVSLPPNAKLPATVHIPLPAGMEVEWAGEISGGDPGSDPKRAFTVKDGDGGKYVELEVSQYPEAQIDLAPVAMTAKDGRMAAQLQFVQSAESSETNFSVRVPSLVSDVKIDPKPAGVPDRNDVGETLYTLPSLTLGTGDKSVVAVSYSTTPPSASDAADKSATMLLWGLGIAAVLALVGLGVAIVRSRRPVE